MGLDDLVLGISQKDTRLGLGGLITVMLLFDSQEKLDVLLASDGGRPDLKDSKTSGGLVWSPFSFAGFCEGSFGKDIKVSVGVSGLLISSSMF